MRECGGYEKLYDWDGSCYCERSFGGDEVPVVIPPCAAEREFGERNKSAIPSISDSKKWGEGRTHKKV